MADTMTVQEVAAALKIHPETVRRWLKVRKLAGRQIGGRKIGWRIPASEVERVQAGDVNEH